MVRATVRLAAAMALLIAAAIVSGCHSPASTTSTRPAKLSDAAKQGSRPSKSKKKAEPQKLSEAAEESSRSDEKQRPGTSERPESDEDDDAQDDDSSYLGTFLGLLEVFSVVDPDDPPPLAVAAGESVDPSPIDAEGAVDLQVPAEEVPQEPEPIHFGVIVGYGTEDGDFEPAPSYGVQLGARTGRLRGDLQVAVSHPGLESGTGPEGLTELEQLAIDLSGRWYLTPSHVLLGPYVLCGARLGLLMWKYGSPVPTGGGDTVEHDSIESIGGRIGVGLSPIQLRHFQLGVNVSLGYKHYAGETSESFENDVFDDTGYHEVTFEAAYHI